MIMFLGKDLQWLILRLVLDSDKSLAKSDRKMTVVFTGFLRMDAKRTMMFTS